MRKAMTQNPQFSNYSNWAAEIITKRIANFKPKMAIVLGSGLGKVADEILNSVVIPYDELPCFNVSHVEGHRGQLRFGMLNNVPVVCLEGRTHPYEGGNALEVVKNIIYTLKLIGCEILFTTNAVGSLNAEIGPGSLMLIKDHINFTFSNILIGRNDERFGDRFISMVNAYDNDLRNKVLNVAKQLGISISEGVYLATSGPSFETPAEIKAFKILGADTVGMSTVPEVIAARHCGIRVVSVSAITNLAAGLSRETLSPHDETLKGAALSIDKLATLILNSVPQLI